MSADNYYFVRKREDGKFDVTHRFASIYYRDEIGDGSPKQDATLEGNMDGWKVRGQDTVHATMELAQAAIPDIPESWIEDVPPQDKTFDTLAEAVLYAHKCVAEDYVVEYGVVVQNGLV